MGQLKKKLAIVWNNEPPCRYVPRAIPGRLAGSFGWEVFDRKLGRGLRDKEISSLPMEAMREIMADA